MMYLLVFIIILLFTQVDIQIEPNVTKKSDLFPRDLTVADLKNFSFSLNNDMCGNDPVTFVIIVSSATNADDDRNILRKVFLPPNTNRRNS